MNREHLLVFADDWGRHPSSCQHLVGHLLSRHQVTWVNTIGTRTPRFDLATVRRGVGKMRQWLKRPSATDEKATLQSELNVVDPRMWPWFSRKIDRWLNRKLLLRRLRLEIEAIPELPVAVTTLPIVADLMGQLPVRRWIYYCVDDFSQWPGLDCKTMARMERLVVERADAIIAVSENLQERLGRMGRDSLLLTHGVDIEFWKANGQTASLLDGLPRPLVVFWGVIDQRMDVEFIRRLSTALTEGTIVLVGPEQDADPALRRLPRVVLAGPAEFALLPRIAREASVLVMPYADLPVTRAMQPLKLKEYLATGKPVVVRDLPATDEWSNSLDRAQDANSFARMVIERLKTGLPESQQRDRERLAFESWHTKALEFEQMVFSDQPSLIGVC